MKPAPPTAPPALPRTTSSSSSSSTTGGDRNGGSASVIHPRSQFAVAGKKLKSLTVAVDEMRRSGSRLSLNEGPAGESVEGEQT